MEVVTPGTPDEFLDLAMPLLGADEAVNCLPIGLATGLRDEPGLYPTYHFWVVVDDGEPVGAALCTPPHSVVLARERRDGAAALLAETVVEVPGIVGPQPELDRFVEAWRRRTGGAANVRTSQAIHELTALEPAPTVDGSMTSVTAGDDEFLLEWLRGFSLEALGEDPPDAERRAWLEHRLASKVGGLVVWRTSDARPVSFAGYGGATPNGIRIGPVYTPPEERRHGYASALVSALTDRLLRDHRFCCLFTDLANPTSNKIYAQLGYRQVCRADEIELVL